MVEVSILAAAIGTVITASGGMALSWRKATETERARKAKSADLAAAAEAEERDALWRRQDELANRLDADAREHERQKRTWQRRQEHFTKQLWDMQRQLSLRELAEQRMANELESVRAQLADSQALIAELQADLANTDEHVAALKEQIKQLGQEPVPVPHPRPRNTLKSIAKKGPK
jgi:chromosome segregation ATPase